MKCAWIPTSLLVAALASCKTTNTEQNVLPAPSSQASAAQESEGRSPAELDRERAKLQAKLDIAKAKLSIAQLELEASAAKHEAGTRFAAYEVKSAEFKLETFTEVTQPNQLASAELSLRRSADRVQEAADELEQIKIMYDEQDLEDMTAEFVVGRGRRNAEHAAAALKIQEAEVVALRDRELREQQDGLQLAVKKAEVALAAAQQQATIGAQRAQIAIREAEGAIMGIERQLLDLEEENQ